MEEHLKEIAKELKLIRLELEQMNGVELSPGGPKINFKVLERELAKAKKVRSARLAT